MQFSKTQINAQNNSQINHSNPQISMIFQAIKSTLIAVCIQMLHMSAAHAAQQRLSPGQAAPLKLALSHAWARATLEPGSNTAGYGQLLLNDKRYQTCTVHTLRSPQAHTVEVHTMVQEGEVMRMQKIPDFTLNLGKVFALDGKPYHIMFIEVAKPLIPQKTQPLKVKLQADCKTLNGKSVQQQATIHFPVQAINYVEGASNHVSDAHMHP